ncbi:MAG: ATP phosphoribosyltransferase regulatory subunit [Clostridia bacterium]|nr:ATP phosphoribosyltransferase regulatory subunit [Clostridia bacterium]
MKIELSTLKKSERLSLSLRKLFEQYSYRKFSMNRMEEYSFYAQNINFLSSKHIITFSDSDGRLMALKPDITLSIAKTASTHNEKLTKLYYIESVFRLSKEAGGFNELNQMGLECIGEITPYTVVEVVSLALKSLWQIGDEEYALDISHQGLITGLFEGMGINRGDMSVMMRFIAEKNKHDLESFAREKGVSDENTDKLLRFLSISGDLANGILELHKISDGNVVMDMAIAEIAMVANAIKSPCLRLQTSLVSDTDYYNGILFNGYVSSVPTAVITGGRYDNLLARMGKADMGGIGFAICFDAIERYMRSQIAATVPTYVYYDENVDVARVYSAAEAVTSGGGTACVCTALPDDANESNTIDLTSGNGGRR